MAKLTPQGYKLKNQNTWFDEERGLYLEIDPNWNLDPSTPDGLKIAHDAEVFSALDETLMQAYNSKDPSKARGIDLDAIAAIAFVPRSQGTPSNVTLLFKGVAGAMVLKDAIIESATTGSRWIVNQAYTLDINGEASVPATAQFIGQTQADTSTLTKIITTMAGVTSVSNPLPATPGTSIENDSSLRIKRRAAVARAGKNQVGSMLGEIYAVDGVRKTRIYENPTGSAAFDATFNPHSLPAHSIAILADGGTDDDVAYAVYVKKNPGVYLADVGTDVTVLVTDPDYPTNTQPIRFNRPTYIDMVLAITIVDSESTLPPNIQDLIRDAFLEFANGSMTDPSCGFRDRGFDIGESIPYSSLYTPINHVIETYGNAYVSVLTVNGVSANQSIAYNELSRWTDSNITVTVT